MLNRNLLRDQTGASAIEYAVIMALIAVSLVGALSSLGGKTSNTFATAGSGMENSSEAPAAAPAPEPPRRPSRDRGNRVPRT